MNPPPSSPPDSATVVAAFRAAVETEVKAVATLTEIAPEAITRAVGLVLACQGRVICTGVGKSGHIARKIAATFASTGTPAYFVHPTEASHGDLGMIGSADVVLAISNSGESKELADLITYSRRFDIPLIAMTKNEGSALARHSDVTLPLPDMPEACVIRMAPTTSTTCSLVIGDALAMAVMEQRGFQKTDFLTFHPGGSLGSQLKTVGDLMHKGASLPVIGEGDTMQTAILEMTSKGFGVAAVVKGDKLVGVITDGDIRRHLGGLLEKNVADVFNANPKTVKADLLASEAVALMNATSITSLLVVDGDGRLEGLLHLHDCLREGLA